MFLAFKMSDLVTVPFGWILGVLYQKPLYRMFGADETLLPYAYEYGKWIFGAFPSFVLTSIISLYSIADLIYSNKFCLKLVIVVVVIKSPLCYYMYIITYIVQKKQ